MINYAKIISLAKQGKTDLNFIIRELNTLWLNDYSRSSRNSEILEIPLNHCSYLLDCSNERLIAAWGISYGRSSEVRDKSRMAGHPLGEGNNYHRGHAIPHTMGGGTDINLVPQLGKVNVGPFRELERKAVASPGALYFTYWTYDIKSDSQKPNGVHQGFLSGKEAQVNYFNN